MTVKSTLSNLPAGLRIPAAREAARRAMPYFSLGIDTMGVLIMPGLGVMGVTAKGALVVDPDILADETALEAGTGLLHEYLHVYSKHVERFDGLVAKGVLKDELADRKLWNVAADLEINDGLNEAKLPMTVGTRQLLQPSTFGFEPDLLAENYLDLLKRRREQGRDSALLDPHKSKPGVGSGHCGSGGGMPVLGEPEDGGASEGSTPERLQDVRSGVDHAMVAYASKTHGKVPKQFLRQASVRVSGPRITWQQELRAAARHAVQLTAGRDDYTFELPSRWTSAFEGQDPQPVLPAMRELVAEVAFVFDTSGSMSPDALDSLLHQAHGVLATMPGCRITMCACDAKVHTLTRVRTVKEMKDKIVGGGGTDFRPAFSALQRFKPRPDIVIFGTDGYGQYPASVPFKVVWLCVPRGEIHVPWGKRIDVS